MKKTFLSTCLLISSMAISQPCEELFFSEYYEGLGANKALEIYNPTTATINLGNYFISRYSNGSLIADATTSVQLSGTIAPHSVFIAVLNDPTADIALTNIADGLYSPNSSLNSCFYFNGDDAIALYKGVLPSDPNASVTSLAENKIIDIIGKIGEQPTNNTGGTSNPTGGWSSMFPHNGNGNGSIVTANHGMIRKSTIQMGETNINIPNFNPLLQWDSIPPILINQGDTTMNIGTFGEHICNCIYLDINDLDVDKIKIYPNPTEKTIHITGVSPEQPIYIYNPQGSLVATTVNTYSFQNKGLYFLKIKTNTFPVLVQ